MLFILYSFSFGLILINKGTFWDDWVYYDVSPSIIFNLCKQTGYFWTGHLLVFLTSLPFGVLFQRLLVFSLYFVSGIFLSDILKNVKEIKEISRFFIVLFFMLFPLNSARILCTTTHYAINYFTFYIAFWILSKYLNRRKRLCRFLSLLIFFFSFSTNSFLVFYIVALAYIVYFETDKFQSLKSTLKRFLLKYLDFIFLPILFWIFKNFFLRPYGLYEGYNKIKFRHLINVPQNLIISFYNSFLEVIVKSLQLSFPQIISITIISSILFIVLKVNLTARKKTKANFGLFLFGLLAFAVAAFPYLAVGKIPKLADWSSRYQLLIPLGASFTLYYGVKILLDQLKLNSSVKIFIFCAITILFVNSNISDYLAFQKDWYKQSSLMEHFKESTIIKNNTSFLFVDNTWQLNANRRNYRYYEYSEMMRYVFGDEIRFGSNINRIAQEADLISDEKFKDPKEQNFFFYYKIKDYEPKNFEYQVSIDYGESALTNKNLARFIFWEFFKPQKFISEIKKIIKLKFTKFNS